MIAGAVAGEPDSGSSVTSPYLDLRARRLEYLGPRPEPSAGDEVREITLGWFGPSDPDEPVAGDLWWSADLAVREANSANGSGQPLIRLIPKWSENPWGTGIAGLFKAVYENKLSAIIGSIDGASTHLAEQVVAKAQLPLLSPVSTDKSVNLAGVSWMFSCAPADDVIAPVMAELAWTARPAGVGRLILVSGTDHDSRALAGELLKALSRKHQTPQFRFEVSPGAVSLEAQRPALARAGPDTVLLVAEPGDAARLVRSIRELAPACVIIGDHRLARFRFRSLAGTAAEGVRLPLLLRPGETEALFGRFAALFRARYQREPDYAAALSYDATRLMMEAIHHAGPDRGRIREELVRLTPWRGMVGEVRWNGLGENTGGTPRPGVIRGGQTRLLESPAGDELPPSPSAKSNGPTEHEPTQH